MCKIRRQLEDKIDFLTRRVDALEEEWSRTDAARGGSVPPPAVDAVAAGPATPPPSSPPPSRATNSPLSDQDDGFQLVRNGARANSTRRPLQ